MADVCRKCLSRAVFWGINQATGKRILVDRITEPGRGTIEVVAVDRYGGPFTIRFLTRVEARMSNLPRYTPHVASCGKPPRPARAGVPSEPQPEMFRPTLTPAPDVQATYQPTKEALP